MIHVAFSLSDDIAATLRVRARNEGFGDLADYLRSLAEAEAGSDAVWEVTPEVAAALEEGERSGYVPFDVEGIVAEARAQFRSE